RFHDKVAIAAFAVLLAVVASGFWGAVVYTGVPRRLTEVEGDLAPADMAEQLDQLGRTMARLAAGRSASFQKVCTGLLAELVPERLAGWKLLFGAGKRKEGDGLALGGRAEAGAGRRAGGAASAPR